MTKVVDSEMRLVALSKIVHVKVDPAVTDNDDDSDPNLVNVVVYVSVRDSVLLRLLRNDCELDIVKLAVCDSEENWVSLRLLRGDCELDVVVDRSSEDESELDIVNMAVSDREMDFVPLRLFFGDCDLDILLIALPPTAPCQKGTPRALRDKTFGGYSFQYQVELEGWRFAPNTKIPPVTEAVSKDNTSFSSCEENIHATNPPTCLVLSFVGFAQSLLHRTCAFGELRAQGYTTRKKSDGLVIVQLEEIGSSNRK